GVVDDATTQIKKGAGFGLAGSTGKRPDSALGLPFSAEDVLRDAMKVSGPVAVFGPEPAIVFRRGDVAVVRIFRHAVAVNRLAGFRGATRDEADALDIVGAA